jgi:hypothetical protein
MHRVVCVVMKRKSCRQKGPTPPHIYICVFTYSCHIYVYKNMHVGWSHCPSHWWGEAYVGSAGTVVCGASSAGLLLYVSGASLLHTYMHAWVGGGTSV